MNEQGLMSIISASRLCNGDDLRVLVSAMYTSCGGETRGLEYILKRGRGEVEVREYWKTVDEYSKSRQPLLGKECSIVDAPSLDVAEQALLESRKMAQLMLRYWASVDSPDEYQSLVFENAVDTISSCSPIGESDWANALYEMFRHRFICSDSSDKNAPWYHFNGIRWVACD